MDELRHVHFRRKLYGSHRRIQYYSTIWLRLHSLLRLPAAAFLPLRWVQGWPRHIEYLVVIVVICVITRFWI